MRKEGHICLSQEKDFRKKLQRQRKMQKKKFTEDRKKVNVSAGCMKELTIWKRESISWNVSWNISLYQFRVNAAKLYHPAQLAIRKEGQA